MAFYRLSDKVSTVVSDAKSTSKNFSVRGVPRNTLREMFPNAFVEKYKDFPEGINVMLAFYT